MDETLKKVLKVILTILILFVVFVSIYCFTNKQIDKDIIISLCTYTLGIIFISIALIKDKRKK